MANTLNKDNVTIWIAPVSTVGSQLAGSADTISGFVTSFGSSGFGQDFEQIDVAGGNVSSTMARAELEGTLDIVLTDGIDRDTFNQIKMGEYDFGTIVVQKDIDGTKYLWEAMNNIVSPIFEGSFAMDGKWEGTLSFKATAFNEDGLHNWDYGTTNVEDALTGLIAGKERTLADSSKRSNSWADLT